MATERKLTEAEGGVTRKPSFKTLRRPVCPHRAERSSFPSPVRRVPVLVYTAAPDNNNNNISKDRLAVVIV